MKKVKLLETLILILLFESSLIFSQEINFSMAIIPDSVKKSTIIMDSTLSVNTDSVKTLFFNKDSIKLKLIFKNDHRWNNWAIDTTLKTTNDSLLFSLLRSKQPYKLSFKYIPLQTTNPDNKEKIKKYLKPGLATLALACNWGSFYLKRVADDYYDKYKYTSDINKINYYYHKTMQYDQISNVLLTVSVVSLSVYLYLLLQ